MKNLLYILTIAIILLVSTNISNAQYWTSNANGIFYDGSVGIGTTNPQSELAVNGTITSKVAVTTQTGWSDFVFKNDYQLPALIDVKEFIKENGHLPGVPSEDYIKKNGNNLGETDAVLLQKIEELTLYLIDLNEKNKKLKAEIEQLKNK